MLKSFFDKINKFYILIIVIVFIVLVIVGGSYFLSNSISIKKTNGMIVEQYEKLNNVASEDGKKYPRVDISSYDNMKSISVEEVLEIFRNNKDAVIYFGYPTCLYCRTAIQVLVDTAKNTELDILYYLDVEKRFDKYDELLNVLGDNFILEENGVKEVYSPLVIFVAKGQIVSYNKGTLFSQDDPYVELDKSQIEGLSEIYRYGIRDVLESQNK